VLGGLVVLVGLALAIASIGVYGEYPTGLSTPFAVVIGIGAIVIVGTGVIAFGLPRGVATRSRPTGFGLVAMIAGLVSVIVFVILVGANLSMTQDTTIPTAGRWLPVALGGLSGVLGILGLVTARGDGPSRRLSLTAILLGLGPALASIWLWSQSCWLFVDRARACVMP
jgi:hypothetical protein